jgi:acetylornithine aminotransferase
VATALENGLLINVTAGNTIRLLPPLIISAPEALELTQGVARLIRDFG